MILEGRVGPATLQDGVLREIRIGRSGEQVVADAHGRYHEAVVRGNVFIAANSATQALSVNSTTATGLILYNPAGSGRNVALLDASVQIASLPAAAYQLVWTGGVQTAAPTGLTALTVRNGFIGGAATGVGLAYSAATIATANILRVIPGGGAATMATSTAYTPFIRDEISGLLILAPGQLISLQALTTAVTVL